MKKITFCLILFLAMLQSQGQVLIGNGTTLKNLPINPYYGYSYSQSIYTAAEINATGQITSLSWYYGGPSGNNIPNSQDLKIYLGHTSKTTFTSNSDWESPENLTEVYAGGIVVNGPGWVSITFNTPFTYNGTDNLIVATAELQAMYDNSGDSFVSQEVSGNRSLVYQNDGVPPNLETPQDGNPETYLPNIIFGGIQKACPTPFFLNTVMTSADTAMIVWGNSAQAPGDSSQYYLSQTNVAPTSSTEATGNSATMAMLTNLQADTRYYFWVRNVCGGTTAEWSYPTSFKTECNPATTIIENFDTTATNSLPACWSSIVRGPGANESTLATTFVGEAFSGPNSVRLFNSQAGSDTDIILVSPKLTNLATNTHRLRFYADANNANQLIIGTLNNNSINATFTPLAGATIDITASYVEYTVDFSEYTGSDSYIGFKLNSSTSFNPASLDNINWEPIPACSDITDMIVENIQPESVTVSWAPGEAGFEVVYDLATGTSDPNSLTPSATTDPSKELTDLTADTRYNVWVRSMCEDGSGAWFGPVAFKSECYPVAELNENFDSVLVPALPNCWTSFIRGTNANTSAGVSVTGFGAASAPNTAILTPGAYVTVDEENDVILVGPNSTTVGAGTHRLKFSAKGNGNLQVGTLDNTTSTATFTALESITVTNNFQDFIVDFSAYQGNDTHFGFRVNSATAYTYTYVDNVKWEVNPACPDVQNLVLEGVSPNAATISWEESGTEAAWEIVYGTPETTDPSILTDIIAAEESTKEITGLEDYTSYVAWVRSDCGTDKGAWIGPIAFKTDCLPTTSLNENFDAVENNSLPACWSSIVRGTTGTAFAKVTTSYAHSPYKSVELHNSNQTDTNDVILVSPNLENLGAGTHRLRFYSSYHYPSSIQVGTLDSNTSVAEFTVLENINLTSTYTEYIVDFTQWGGITDKYIGIRLNNNIQNSYAHIDDLVWEVAPMCPSVETVAVTDITTDGAFVTWEMGELTAENWEVSYALSTITDANAGNINELNLLQEYVIENLTPDTEYNVWVRSLCGDDEGEWVGPIAFRTKCIAGTVFNEDFEATSGNTLPECWTRIVRGDSFAQHFASVMVTPINPNSGSKAVSLFNSTNNSGNDIMLISPPMDNLATGTHQLTFYLKGNTGGVQIGTLNNNTSSTANFTSLTTVEATNSYTKHTIDFTSYIGTNVYIGIRHGGTNNTTIYVDDIVWEPIPAEGCNPVASINENFDTTEVNSIPECWTAILRGPSEDDIDSIGVKETGSASAPNAVNIFKGMSGPQDDQILVLPQLSNLNAGTHKLAFSHAGPTCQVEVGTLSNNTDTAVFTLKETVTVTGNWTQSIIDFANYTGTDTYIGLRLNSGEAPFLGMFIDNVIWTADLGNGTFDNSKFAFYPNPVKNILNLSYEQNITHVAVYNVLGQEIITKKFNTNNTQVDMSGLASGTYIVKVTADNVNKTFKVIKE